ncbi:uncharacterized protein CANTADRAFT_28419, partial [Suhomyces tanzawaensis NRRL Y-17324]
LFGQVMGSWLFKEAKTCDPSLSNFYVFSGFKINRIHHLDLAGLTSTHLVSLDHCNYGKNDYGNSYQSISTVDIDWERPFCMLKPATKNPDLPSILPNTTQSNQVPLVGWKEVVKTNFDAFTDKVTILNGILPVSDWLGMEKSEERQIEKRVACYKMARRRKHAKRNYTFYMPGTFVGGLFECPVPLSHRNEVLKQITNNLPIYSLEFKCEASRSIPILPLIAQDMTIQWLEFDVKTASVKHSLPYLSSPSPLDLRFSGVNNLDWAKGIDVNENYKYERYELDLISRTVGRSSNFIGKLVASANLAYFAKLLNIRMLKSGLGEPALRSVAENLPIMTKDQKFSIILALTDKGKEYLRQLQMFW